MPGPGMITVEEYCLLGYKGQIMEVDPRVGFGLTGLHIKGVLQASLYSLQELAKPGRGSLSGIISKAPKCQTNTPDC